MLLFLVLTLVLVSFKSIKEFRCVCVVIRKGHYI